MVSRIALNRGQLCFLLSEISRHLICIHNSRSTKVLINKVKNAHTSHLHIVFAHHFYFRASILPGWPSSLWVRAICAIFIGYSVVKITKLPASILGELWGVVLSKWWKQIAWDAFWSCLPSSFINIYHNQLSLQLLLHINSCTRIEFVQLFYYTRILPAVAFSERKLA